MFERRKKIYKWKGKLWQVIMVYLIMNNYNLKKRKDLESINNTINNSNYYVCNFISSNISDFYDCALIQFVIPIVLGFQSRCWSSIVCVFVFISWIVCCCYGLFLCCKSPFLDCFFFTKGLYYIIVIWFMSFVDKIFIIPSNLCLFHLVCHYYHYIIIHQSILLYLILRISNSLIIILIESCSCFLL